MSKPTLRHKTEVEGFPRHVGPTPGHLSECLVVTLREFAETFGGPWPPPDPEFPYCTCKEQQ